MKTLARYQALSATLLIAVGCGGSGDDPGINQYATWDIEVTSTSPFADQSPIKTSRYECSDVLELSSDAKSIHFGATFSRSGTRQRYFRITGFDPKLLKVGRSIKFGSAGTPGANGAILDYKLGGPGYEFDYAYEAIEGGVEITSVDGDRVTFAIDALFESSVSGGPRVSLNGTYSYNFSRGDSFVSFKPCPAR